MSEICITSSSAATRGATFLALADDGVVTGGERNDQRRQRLGQAMRVERIVRHSHFRHALELSGHRGGGGDVLAGDKHVDRTSELERGGERARGRVVQLSACDFGQKKGRHRQITPASSWSLPTSSATDLTLTPALRPAGSEVFSTLRRGETSTP